VESLNLLPEGWPTSAGLGLEMLLSTNIQPFLDDWRERESRR